VKSLRIFTVIFSCFSSYLVCKLKITKQIIPKYKDSLKPMKRSVGMIRNHILASLSATIAAGISTTLPARALTFNFLPAEGTSTDVINAFNLAGDRWSNAIKDDITLNIVIGQQKIDDGSLGFTNPTTGRVKATDFLAQLRQDATSTSDAIATNTLPISNDGSIARIINHTSNNGGATHLDTSTQDIWLTSANAKALGLLAGDRASLDAEITINSNIAWDYDGDSQIAADNYDLVTTVTHELGHALGIVSSVDILESSNFDDFNLTPCPGARRDYGMVFHLSPSPGARRDYGMVFHLSPSPGARRDYGMVFHLQGEGKNTTDDNTSMISDADLNFVSGFDLFRYSATSAAVSAIDMTLSTEAKYFSINGGVDPLIALAKGESIDGTQSSHTLGGASSIMDPHLAEGTVKEIASLDRTILDAMGWDFEGTSNTNYRFASGNFTFDNASSAKNLTAGTRTPEPSATIALFGLGLLTSISFWQRRCQ
jgi:PEP-CTERM motif